MKSLLNTILSAFSRGFAGHAAARLGEGQHNISKALNGIAPVVLGALIVKAEAGGAQAAYDLSRKAVCSVNGNIASVTAMLGILGSGRLHDSPLAQGEQLTASLFARSNGPAASLVSAYAGIQPASAQALLGLVGAVVLRFLGRHCAEHHLGSSAATSLLVNLKVPVRTLFPRDGHELHELWRNLVVGEPVPGLLRKTPKLNFNITVAGTAVARLAAIRWRQARGFGAALLASSVLMLSYFVVENEMPTDSSAAWSATPVAFAPGATDSTTAPNPMRVPILSEKESSRTGSKVLSGSKMSLTEN